MGHVRFTYADPSDPVLKRLLIRGIEACTGQPRLKRLYEELQREPRRGESFWSASVRSLGLDVRFDRNALASAPREGPLVIVANHPFGVVDGLVIAWLAEKVRPDFRILTNAVLLRAPEARPWLLPVDFAATPEAKETNIATRRAARDWLAAGGCIVVFPAGGVSTSPDRLGRLPAVDAPWQPFTAALVQQSRATVLPVWFHGQNGRLFQMASHVGLTPRLALLFKEVSDRIGTPVDVSIGRPVTYEALRARASRSELASHLRALAEAVGRDNALHAVGQDGSDDSASSGPVAEKTVPA